MPVGGRWGAPTTDGDSSAPGQRHVEPGTAAKQRRGDQHERDPDLTADQVGQAVPPSFASLRAAAVGIRPQAPRTLEGGHVIMAEGFCRFAMYETSIRSRWRSARSIPTSRRQQQSPGTVMTPAWRRPGNSYGALAKAMREPLDEAGGRVQLNPFTARLLRA
jgi:hypothetical protein